MKPSIRLAVWLVSVALQLVPTSPWAVLFCLFLVGGVLVSAPFVPEEGKISELRFLLATTLGTLVILAAAGPAAA